MFEMHYDTYELMDQLSRLNEAADKLRGMLPGGDVEITTGECWWTLEVTYNTGRPGPRNTYTQRFNTLEEVCDRLYYITIGVKIACGEEI